MYSEAGFTLIELMITLVIMAVVLAFAVPNMEGLGRDTRMTSATNSIVTVLNQARSEAVKRADTVSICPSGDQANCTNNDDWTVGWISWHDADADGAVDGTEELLRVGDGEDNMSIGTGGVTTITYTAEGSIDNGGAVTFTLEPDTCKGDAKREIEINLSGRPRADRVTC